MSERTLPAQGTAGSLSHRLQGAGSSPEGSPLINNYGPISPQNQMTSLANPMKEVSPPFRGDKYHLVLCVRGGGQPQGRSHNADAQQLPALKPRGVVAMGMERALADSIWSLCLSLSEAAGCGRKQN